MRKFITKMQDLSKKAAALQQTVQGMPAKAAELRQAVVMSAGELQQIRTDVHSTLNGLRTNTEDGLLQAMRQINDHTDTFEEAGYELTGMDLDLALTQRLAVQFKKFEDVSHSTLRSLLSSQTQETIKAILSGIIKAEETAANVELSHLQYDGVIVHVGAVPMVRMSWRSDTFVDQQTVVEGPQPTVAPSPAPAPSAIGSFFEKRTIPITTAQSSIAPAPVNAPAEVPSSIPVIASNPQSTVEEHGKSKASALDRFKKMPDLSKSRY